MICLSDTCRNSIEDGLVHICIIKLTLRDKHEPQSTENKRMETTHSKQQTSHTCVLVTWNRKYIVFEITSHEDRQSTAETGGQIITEFTTQAKPS